MNELYLYFLNRINNMLKKDIEKAAYKIAKELCRLNSKIESLEIDLFIANTKLGDK